MNFNDGEDTFFQMKKSLNCRGKLLDLSTPAIMGILNITPDSFYDGGKFQNEKSVLDAAEEMLKEGVDIIDIGGQSSRPGALRVLPDEEWNRISSTLFLIADKFPNAILSVDTFYAEVAEKAFQAGAAIVNDISAGEFDKDMLPFIAKSRIPYIVMHKKGDPENMQENPNYEDVVNEVLTFFIDKIGQLKNLGISDVVIDPGFGFGKTILHNYSLLKNLKTFKILNCPILAGLSRKSMITRVLNVKPTEALTGTVALNTIALLNGASILRVHDVGQAIEVRKLIKQYMFTE
jgi:dihydropteroate synthase